MYKVHIRMVSIYIFLKALSNIFLASSCEITVRLSSGGHPSPPVHIYMSALIKVCKKSKPHLQTHCIKRKTYCVKHFAISNFQSFILQRFSCFLFC